MFLFPWFGRSNLRRMANLAIDPQPLHQAQKPLHRSRCFNSYTHRPWQPRIKLLHVTATVCQRLFHHLPGRCIEHRQCLLASVQIASYNPHLGLLRSEHCWGQHRTVYSGRREAGVVMTSTRDVGTGTQLSGYPTNSLLKNLDFEVFSFSVLSFRRVVREWFWFFDLLTRLVEATCHVLAIRVRSRHRL